MTLESLKDPVFLAVLVVGLAFIGLEQWYSKRLVRNRCDANGYVVVECDYSPTWLQTFGLFRTKQWRYRIVVRDARGNARSGYAWSGGFFLGLLSSSVKVEWD